MWETGTLSEGVSGRIWVEMGLQCLWAVFGNFTPFEGVGNFWVSTTPSEGVGRWGRIGPEMGAPSEGGTISRETAHLRKMGKGRKEGECGYRLCRAHGAGTHLRKVGRVRPEDSGVRWLDGLRSRKVG